MSKQTFSYKIWKFLRVVFLVSASLTFLTPSTIIANPQGGQVVSGDITIQHQTPDYTHILQKTDKGSINWQSFNIGASQHTHFQQPSVSSMTLNRVMGKDPSSILGRLTATGQILLINRAGILFGPGSKVDVAGLIATTADITDANFNQGIYKFVQDSGMNSTVVNLGNIKVSDYGIAALVAPGVENAGVIQAKFGKVALASGTKFTLDLMGDDLIHFEVGSEVTNQLYDSNGQKIKDAVKNSGQIIANGGTVLLSARVAKGIVDNVINMSGIIQANAISEQGGKIILHGGTEGVVRVAGNIEAKGTEANQKGGEVQILGEKVGLFDNAKIDVSGTEGGGTVLIGGDYQGKGPLPISSYNYMGPNAQVLANAIINGDGGKIVLFSENATRAYGKLEAKGGSESGSGGLIETSSKQYLSVLNAPDVSAQNGLGGMWLLDPYNLTISTGADANVTGSTPFQPDSGTAVLNVTTLQDALDSGNVTVQTLADGGVGDGDITVANDVTWSSAYNLLLSAFRHVVISGGVTVSNTGSGDLNVRADNTGIDIGTITQSGTIDYTGSTGDVNFYYNPASYPTADTFSNVNMNTGTFTAYMLINTLGTEGGATGLQGMSGNLSGNYALGKNIDADATSGWTGGFAPIGSSGTPFTGSLNGDNKIVSGLFIDRSSTDSVGLIGYYAGVANSISNLGLTGNSITGQNSTGGVIGQVVSGTVSNVYNQGEVTGASWTGGVVGWATGGFGLSIILVTLGLGILLVFGLLGIQIVLQVVGFYLISLIALILMPFGVFTPSRGMFEKPVQTVLKAGVRVAVLIMVMGVAVGIWHSFNFTALTGNFNINQPLGLFFTGLLFLYLAIKLPALAAEAVGQISMRFAVDEAPTVVVTQGASGGTTYGGAPSPVATQSMQAATAITPGSGSQSGFTGSSPTQAATTVVVPPSSPTQAAAGMGGASMSGQQDKSSLTRASRVDKSISDETLQKIKKTVSDAIKRD